MNSWIATSVREGAFGLFEPLTLPEGTRIHLSIEEKASAGVVHEAKIHTPRLGHPEAVAGFEMEVRETG